MITTSNPTLHEVALDLGITWRQALDAVVKREVPIENGRISRRRIADVYFGSPEAIAAKKARVLTRDRETQERLNTTPNPSRESCLAESLSDSARRDTEEFLRGIRHARWGRRR